VGLTQNIGLCFSFLCIPLLLITFMLNKFNHPQV
jgi:hypothetical protein